MEKHKFFLAELIEGIENQYGKSGLHKWRRDEIEIFLADVREKVQSLCKRSLKLTKLLDVPRTKDIGYNYEAIKIPDYYTFRRNFITKQHLPNIIAYRKSLTYRKKRAYQEQLFHVPGRLANCI